MNLMEMVNGLNRLDDRQPFSPGAFLLAVKMIDLMNRLYWPETVTVDLARMGVMGKLASRNAVVGARDELVERGVLEIVSKGKKGSPTVYRLMDLSGFGSRGKQYRGGIGEENGSDQGPINKIKEKEMKSRQDVGEKRGRFQPPTADEVRDYVQEAGAGIDAQRFWDFYEAKGWRIGSNPMRDWKAAVRTWAGREAGGGGNRGSGSNERLLGHQQYSQRQYTNNYDALDEMMRKYLEEHGEE